MGKFPRFSLSTSSDDLTNIMACAKWLVGEFERIHCSSLANLFQQAVDDAESWIHQMNTAERMTNKTTSAIKQKEIKFIHEMLTKYASISDPDTRKKTAHRMKASVVKALDKDALKRRE